MSSLKGLNVALTALQAHQRAIEVAGQNIANANTKGYTRQRVNLVSAGAPVTPAIHSVSRTGGDGVKIENIQRLNDAFLEQRALQEHAADSSLQRTQRILAQVEQNFGEPGDNGIAAQLDEFWAGWEDVANRPSDPAARTQLLQRAETLASTMRKVDSDLVRLREQTVDEMGTIVTQVNSLAKQISGLNNSIQTATLNGLSPNDLADQRDELIRKLGTLAGATIKPAENGAVDVYLGGTALVRGATVSELAQPTTDGSGNVTVAWAIDDYPVDLTGGELQALRQAVNVTLSDGTTGGVDGYRKKLNDVAIALRDQVNAVHAAGRDLQSPEQAGAAFFTGSGAVDFSVNPAVVSDPLKVAAATPGAGRLDGSNALAMAEVANANGSPDRIYSALVVGLGVEADTANRRAEIQAEVVIEADSARESASGVNLDEEMTNLVGYQHAYAAAARVMNAVNEALDVLINRTGV
jgi:flagellar hook-associated protein 1 FlgK